MDKFTAFLDCLCVWGCSYPCIVACTHFGNGTGHRTATDVTQLLLLLTSGPAMYEAVFHSCGTSPVGGGDRFVIVHTQCKFMVLHLWDIRLPASLSAIPLSLIFLTQNQLVLALSHYCRAPG